MEKRELLRHLEVLGREFVRRGMSPHAHKLRVYFAAMRNGLVPSSNELQVHWSEEMTLEWMRTLRLAPFEDSYEVRPANLPCFKCRLHKGQQPSSRTECVFPGGARIRCDHCRSVWLVETG